MHIKKINIRVFSAFLHDLAVIVIAWQLAFNFRFNFSIPTDFLHGMFQNIVWILPLKLSFFVLLGLYKGVWRFASLPDLLRILKAIVLSASVIIIITAILRPTALIPRSVLILDPILTLLLMAGSRLAYRLWKEHRLYGHAFKLGKPVLVLGAGDATMRLLRDLERSRDWRVVGILDDSNFLHGRVLHGCKILGAFDDVSVFAKKLNVENVIVSMPASNHKERHKAVALATEAGLKVFTVPAFEDLISGKLSVSQIRTVEVEDLLGRDVVQLDNQGLSELITGKTVMITGAGGSIGSELCRQVLKLSPQKLICIDISEYSLYQLEQELNIANTSVINEFYTADVKNVSRVSSILENTKPSIVFHAAAYKHVPLMELRNVAEALTNNVFGTYVLAKACQEFMVDKFILISTDKAVNPTNVMGSSKRLAEMVCQGLQSSDATRFITVRFGNVLGSSGSVIPKFREQIARGGPVTVTDPEITRYFMSIPEAAQLVMQAALMGQGGEIFVLDMGDPVKIVDLAKDMIRLSGFSLEDIKVEFTGLRPGEKLYEELLANDETTITTPHPKLRIAIARSSNEEWVQELIEWISKIQNKDEMQIKIELKSWVEEYTPDIGLQNYGPEITPNSITLH